MAATTIKTTSPTPPATRRRVGILAVVAALFAAAFALLPTGMATAATDSDAKGERVRAATADTTNRYEILRRGALIISWGSGYEDVQTIQGGWLEMNGTVGHGELLVRDMNGQAKTHTITDAYPAMGGLGLELEVQSGGMFPQVVTLSTAAAGSPLYQGPDGGYEGDLEDWAGINDAEVRGLTFNASR